MCLFKILGKYSQSKQANKLANIHTHVRNEVMLVWGSLRLAPNIAEQYCTILYYTIILWLMVVAMATFCITIVWWFIIAGQAWATARTATVSVPKYVWTKLYTKLVSWIYDVYYKMPFALPEATSTTVLIEYVLPVSNLRWWSVANKE